MVTRRPAWAFSPPTARQVLGKHFATAGLEGFGFSDDEADAQAIRAAGAVLDYLAETQKSSLAHIDRLLPYRASGTLEIDEASRRSLEICRTIRDARREGSLLWVLDRTVTAMGSRLLAEWVANPLTDAAAIARGWTPCRNWSATNRCATGCTRTCGGSTTWSGCWPA